MRELTLFLRSLITDYFDGEYVSDPARNSSIYRLGNSLFSFKVDSKHLKISTMFEEVALVPYKEEDFEFLEICIKKICAELNSKYKGYESSEITTILSHIDSKFESNYSVTALDFNQNISILLNGEIRLSGTIHDDIFSIGVTTETSISRVNIDFDDHEEDNNLYINEFLELAFRDLP